LQTEPLEPAEYGIRRAGSLARGVKIFNSNEPGAVSGARFEKAAYGGDQ